jgi:predicted outer membrane lipoprotein
MTALLIIGILVAAAFGLLGWSMCVDSARREREQRRQP